jgi:hypothetical protein
MNLILCNSWTHFRQVNDSNEMSQMNVFQKLGHAYIPSVTSDLHHEIAAQHGEISLVKQSDT